MNNKIILALSGVALLIAAVFSVNNPIFPFAQAQNQSQNNTGIQGSNNNTGQTVSNRTITASNVTLHLHAQLDAAIIAAQNNDTLGVLASLSQITEGLTAINDPSSTATGIAATSNPETTISNQTSSNNQTASNNQTTATSSSNNTTTTSGGVGTDDPASGSDNPYSDFT